MAEGNGEVLAKLNSLWNDLDKKLDVENLKKIIRAALAESEVMKNIQGDIEGLKSRIPRN